MHKKIKDLKINDIPKCWNKLFMINNALMCLFTTDEKKLEYIKSTIPEEYANIEIEVNDNQKDYI